MRARQRRYVEGNSLVAVAAAVVGSAAAAQVIAPKCPVTEEPCPGDEHGRICRTACSSTDDAELAGQAFNNTYETGAPAGTTSSPAQLDVVGANGRRLIARWMPEGVWVGGCMIASREDAEKLAAFITREGDE